MRFLHFSHAKKSFALALAVAVCGLVARPAARAQPAGTDVRSVWPQQTAAMKPWVRWWWLGSDVDTLNLGRQIDAMRDAGIGGAEVTPVYGVQGREANTIPFLTPEWVKMLQFSIDRAARNGMGIDMNLGTGWPFGGPQITPDLGAGKLRLFRISAAAGKRGWLRIPPDSLAGKGPARIAAVTAYGPAGEVIGLAGKTDSTGIVRWAPRTGSWEVLVAVDARTGQKVKRAAPGGEGLVLDHLRREATQIYAQRFDTALGAAAGQIRSFFNDSYEVYGADFTPELFDAFQRLRGYDLKRYLKQLYERRDSDTMRRLRADYRQTVSDLVRDGFAQPLNEWSHRKGAGSRSQAHGAPGNLLDLYAAVDVPETEMFGIIPVSVPGMHYYTSPDSFNHPAPDPVMLRFAGSAANVMGRPLVSCETFTWLGEHFRIPLSNCKPEVEQAFLSGINHIFYHGMPYSPAAAAWPGWLFYASTHVGPTNTWWPHINGLNDYIARTQSILQTSAADNEVLVYWPYDDVRQLRGNKGMLQMLQMNNINDWLTNSRFYTVVKHLDHAGFQADFVSDDLLDKAITEQGTMRISGERRPYRAVVVPALGHMRVATLRKLYDLALGGTTIVFQELPDDVPGLNNHLESRRRLREFVASIPFATISGMQVAQVGNGHIYVAAAPADAIKHAGLRNESTSIDGIRMLRKTRNGDKLYYLVNHTANDFNGWIPTQIRSGNVRILDPLTGSWGKARSIGLDGRTIVRLDLPAGTALFLEAGRDTDTAWAYTTDAANSLGLEGPWKLHALDGGRGLPGDTVIARLVDWSKFPAPFRLFSGRIAYTTSFRMTRPAGNSYVLNLGDVRESARVYVNGKDAGIVWSVPARIGIGHLLRTGQNEIRIEVANLMANRIADMDQRGDVWRIFKEINFVNFNYKPFDASGWTPMPSGLLGPVTITRRMPSNARK